MREPERYVSSHQDVRLGALGTPRHPARLSCEASIPLEHLRADVGARIYNALDVSALSERSPDQVFGEAVYGGPWFNHFGHMAAEGVHRLWAAVSLASLRHLPIVFQAHPRERLDHGWFEGLLACWGIPAQRVLPIRGPTFIERLHVPKQGRVLGGQIIIPSYLENFPFCDLDHSSSRRLYFSRSKHIDSGSYLGETYMEALLSHHGFEIVYAEYHSPKAVISKLASADIAIFAEGSAIHHLDVLGPVRAKIYVIGRRDGTTLRFEEVLRPVAQVWRIYEGGSRSVSAEWDQTSPHRRRACSFIDLAALIKDLSCFIKVDFPLPSDSQMRLHTAYDLLRYLMNPKTAGLADEYQLGSAIKALKSRKVVRDLLDRAWF